VSFYPPSRPRAVQGGLTARSTRGSIGETWWSQRFIGVLEGFALGSRLTRGRAYARRGQVISLLVAPGVVTARVQGSRATPYKVALGLAPFTSATWAAVDIALAGQAIHSAALLAGQLPPDLEGVFDAAGARLFPLTVHELRMSCSCPDREVPCKHLAASFYLLAERFDHDPFEILHWRGRPREVLLTRLRELRDATAPPAAGPAAIEPAEAGALQAGTIGTAIALADLPAGDTSVPAAMFWSSPVPLSPAEPGPETPPDLLLRQLPEPSAALGGVVLVDALRGLYLALPDPDGSAAPERGPARRG
jgi:uncharacterized Zn finger protein